jgi:hypothetical protein
VKRGAALPIMGFRRPVIPKKRPPLMHERGGRFCFDRSSGRHLRFCLIQATSPATADTIAMRMIRDRTPFPDFSFRVETILFV